MVSIFLEPTIIQAAGFTGEYAPTINHSEVTYANSYPSSTSVHRMATRDGPLTVTFRVPLPEFVVITVNVLGLPVWHTYRRQLVDLFYGLDHCYTSERDYGIVITDSENLFFQLCHPATHKQKGHWIVNCEIFGWYNALPSIHNIYNSDDYIFFIEHVSEKFSLHWAMI